MYKILTIAVASTILVGCANANYSEYLVAQQNIELAHAQAEAERYKAMAEIARYGDTTTQVAAMMSMQAQGTSPNNNRRSPVAAPKSTLEEVRAWASILVPGLTQITINGQNTAANMHNSDNNARISITNSDNNRLASVAQSENDATVAINEADQATLAATNTANAFVDIAQEIQAPAANYTDSNNSYADSYNADSNNDQSDNSNNSDNSDNSNNSDNSVTDTVQ